MNKLILILPALILFEAGRITLRALQPKLRMKKHAPYSQHPANPTFKILVLGDSFGIGIGASDSSQTLIGNMGRDLPDADITNYSVSGYTIKQLLEHAKTQHLQNYDMILFLLGGMNIVKLSPLKKIKKDLEELVIFFRPLAKHLVFLVPHRSGDLPLYSFVERGFLNYRSGKVEQIFQEILKKYECITVPQDASRLLVDVKKYFFEDHSHPNDVGYVVCYEQLKSALVDNKILND